MTFASSVSNIGSSAAVNFPNMFQISSVSDFSTTYDLVNANPATVSSLAVGASTNVSGAYTFAAAGTYYVRECVNTNALWGGSITESDTSNNCGSGQQIVISSSSVIETLAVSCVGSPGNPYINQPVTWSSSVTSGTGPYTYSWSGNESLSGTTASITKSYAVAGIKSARVFVTDSTSQVGSAICTTGAKQANGPPAADTGGVGVSVGACTATITANPSALTSGSNTSLTWSVSGGSLCASSCSGVLNGITYFETGGAISRANVPASYLPTPPSTSYALTCQAGTYGPPPTAYATVAVAVDAPTVTVSTPAPPGATETGQTSSTAAGNATGNVAIVVDPTVSNNVTIAWQPPEDTAIQSCSITKNGAAWAPGSNLLPSGSITTTATTRTTYVVDCQTVGATPRHAMRTILVNVSLNYQEF
ncbi:MAG: hypothetical protein Q8L52_01750 [bacterium]|nr:hypothetical protein [bacterium]